MASIAKPISTRVVVDKKTGKESTVTTERHRARYRDEAGGDHPRLGSEVGGFHAFVAVCAFAGLRLEEAAGTQLDDIDFLRRNSAIQRQIQGQVNSKTVEVSPK